MHVYAHARQACSSTPYELAPILAWELAEHVMKPWLRPRAFLERYSTRFCEALIFWLLSSKDLDEILANKANQ